MKLKKMMLFLVMDIHILFNNYILPIMTEVPTMVFQAAMEYQFIQSASHPSCTMQDWHSSKALFRPAPSAFGQARDRHQTDHS